MGTPPDIEDSLRKWVLLKKLHNLLNETLSESNETSDAECVARLATERTALLQRLEEIDKMVKLLRKPRHS